MSSRHVIIIVLAVLLMSGAVAHAQNGPPPTPVRGVEVTTEQMQERQRVAGEFRARARSMVAAIEPGLVTEYDLQEGQRITKGDVMARLDDAKLKIDRDRLEAQVAASEAAIDVRAAELELSRNDLEAIRALRERSGGTRKELLDAEAAFKVAESRIKLARRELDVAKSQIDLLNRRIEDMVITAPFDGVVIGTETEVGQWLGAGDVIAELIATDALEAWLSIPQRFASAIAEKDSAIEIMVDADRRMLGPFHPQIVPNITRRGRSFSVIFIVENEDGALIPGMSITGWAPTGKTGEYLTIPSDAVMLNQTGPYVMAARMTGPDTKSAVPTSINIAFEFEGRVAMSPGVLQEGDVVITEGNERLFPMTAVTVSIVEPKPRTDTAMDGRTGDAAPEKAGG